MRFLSLFCLSSIRHRFCFLAVGLLLFASCANRVDRDILDEGLMTDILYDYHLSMAMLERVAPDSTGYYGMLYEKSILTKYHVSKEQFDKSLRWYETNPERLSVIYENLSERFNIQSNSLDSDDHKGRVWTSEGDTANVWSAVESVLLSASGVNRFSFALPTDSSYHGGDRFEWIFDVNWMYQEGRKQAFAVLLLTYANDSVATVSMPVYSSGRQMVVAYSNRSRELKQISGFIYQVAPWHQRPRLMSVTGLTLMRYHIPQPKSIPSDTRINEEEKVSDSLVLQAPEKRIRDSLVNKDREKRDHFKGVEADERRIPMQRLDRRADLRR